MKKLFKPGAAVTIRLNPFLFLLLFSTGYAYAQQKSAPIVHSFFLVGDAGEPYIKDQHLGDVLRQHMATTEGTSTVLYLGDNIYPNGLPEAGSPARKKKESVLRTQMSWIKGLNTQGIFVPGNHDWDQWGKRGLLYVRNQQQWVDSLKDTNFTFLPKQGCPGPVEIPVNEKLTLVILDTQWFLHQWEKPGTETCQAGSTAEAMKLLNEIFERNKDKRIVIAAHHPLITYGEHGGVFGWKSHLFPLTSLFPKLYIPLPVLGSLYVLYRKSFPDIQDTAHPEYKNFIRAIQPMLEEHAGYIYVSGHEHALQYSIKANVHYIVSGSGSKVTQVRKKRFAKFAKSVCGFVQLSQHADGVFSVHYFRVDAVAPEGKEIYKASIQ
jgi:hypothetical protein